MSSKDEKLPPLSEQPSPTIGKGDQLGEIVVFIDGETEAPSILEFAGVLAEEHGTHLIRVFIQSGPTVTTAQTFRARQGHTRSDGRARPRD